MEQQLEENKLDEPSIKLDEQSMIIDKPSKTTKKTSKKIINSNNFILFYNNRLLLYIGLFIFAICLFIWYFNISFEFKLPKMKFDHNNNCDQIIENKSINDWKLEEEIDKFTNLQNEYIINEKL